MNDPERLHYTSDHEWITDPQDGVVTVGVTDYAAEQLGDVVYVDLPEVGRVVEAGESAAEVETTKSVSDVFAPVTGAVVEVNDDAVDHPELLNDDPFGDGWLFRVRLDGGLPDDLLDLAAYRALTEGDGE